MRKTIAFVSIGLGVVGCAAAPAVTLKPGYLADLMIFDAALAADRLLLDRKVVAVLVGGNVVYGNLPIAKNLVASGTK